MVDKKMKVLLMCAYFPPYNVAGSLRVGRIAQHLSEMGHEVKVIAADTPQFDKSLGDIKGVEVKHLRYTDINDVLRKLAGGKEKALSITQSDKNYLSFKQKLALKISRVYANLTNIPDVFTLFGKQVEKEAILLCQDWKPDMIYASALPASVALAGYKVHKLTGIPWICEFRDLWTQNHYYSFCKWRKWWDTRLEKKALKTTSGLVTVSEPLKKNLLARYSNKPVKVIINGIDDTMLEVLSQLPSPIFSPNLLKIVYTGSLYKGRRDPAILLESLSRIYKEKLNAGIEIQLHFYGRDGIFYLTEQAKKFDIEDKVFCHDVVPYKEALVLQREADALLLLLWDNIAEEGVFTGKLFEYIGAERPIIAIGPSKNVAIQAIKNRKLGWHLTDVNQGMQILQNLIEQKQNGGIIGLPAEAKQGFTRKEQSVELVQFIQECLY